ncbi:hypothetical protein [Flagellimonas meishanensis]|uniref:hypothetical protein n=1 Tax=Flagellimonas meishanensis TaxID=2873264 RepID=UPI001CA75D5B|nr:hypothetical protein [[Muricauda] meishanensis]
MITFLGILFGLLAINAILLLFSVNGATEGFGGSTNKNEKTSVTKLLPRESSETEYKKAV